MFSPISTAVIVNNVTNNPARIIPIVIKANARIGGILNIHEAKVAVQAPVKGKGIITKIIKNKEPYFVILS